MSARSKVLDLDAELERIVQTDRAGAIKAWKTTFKSAPPKYLSLPFMQRVLIHDLQCRRLGSHTVATRRALKLALEGRGDECVAPLVGEGATLVREWNGRIYRVEATAEGYVLDGKTYASLSAVARHITGARWSGPRFFGLTPVRSA